MPLLEEDDNLVEAADLAAFPGGPFVAVVVAAAAQAVRDHCGWHIAPVREETLTVEAWGGDTVLLPTMHLVSISAVRDVTSNPVGEVVVDYSEHATDRFKAGILTRAGGWPYGVVKFDVEHGYEACPAGLAAAIAELCRAQVRGDLASRSLGDKSESWRDVLSPTSQQALAHYRIPRSP